jgi:hypothetical protein
VALRLFTSAKLVTDLVEQKLSNKTKKDKDGKKEKKDPAKSKAKEPKMKGIYFLYYLILVSVGLKERESMLSLECVVRILTLIMEPAPTADTQNEDNRIKDAVNNYPSFKPYMLRSCHKLLKEVST